MIKLFPIFFFLKQSSDFRLKKSAKFIQSINRWLSPKFKTHIHMKKECTKNIQHHAINVWFHTTNVQKMCKTCAKNCNDLKKWFIAIFITFFTHLLYGFTRLSHGVGCFCTFLFIGIYQIKEFLGTYLKFLKLICRQWKMFRPASTWTKFWVKHCDPPNLL